MKLVYRLALPIYLSTCQLSWSKDPPPIPPDLLEEVEDGEENGVNEFTAPSIAKVFDELDKISPLAYDRAHVENHERLPLDRAQLALRLGTLIANGFIAVQTGNPDDVPVIASHLSRYGKALGAGDKVKRHAASLLDHAKEKDLDKLKRALASTQRDVEEELADLRDPDLSHLISLGGWLQALESASLAVDKKFTPERAATLFREDVADYYAESIGALNPALSSRPHMTEIRTLLHGLRNSMVLEEGVKPTEAQVSEIAQVASKLAKAARK